MKGKNHIRLVLGATLLISITSCKVSVSDLDNTESDEGGVGGNQVSAPQNGIVFMENYNTRYGFDAKEKSEDVYVSVRSEDDFGVRYTTRIDIKVENHDNGAFVESDNEDVVKINNSSDFLENDAVTEIELEGVSEGSACINVLGITGETGAGKLRKSAVVTAEIEVLVYNDLTTDRIDFTTVDFHPSEWDYDDDMNESKIEEGMNSILKQPVFEQETIFIRNHTGDSWDVNGNGYLDIWYSGESVTEEYMYLTESSGIKHGIAVFENIRAHWELDFDAYEGGVAVTVDDEAAQAFVEGEMITIGPFGDNDPDETETHIIGGVSSDGNLYLKGEAVLAYDHPQRSHSVWSDTKLKGIAPMPEDPAKDDQMAVVRRGASIKAIVHEFLHQKGRLKHVEEESNLMYPNVDDAGTYLRYRRLDPYDDTEDGQFQWDMIDERR